MTSLQISPLYEQNNVDFFTGETKSMMITIFTQTYESLQILKEHIVGIFFFSKFFFSFSVFRIKNNQMSVMIKKLWKNNICIFCGTILFMFRILIFVLDHIFVTVMNGISCLFVTCINPLTDVGFKSSVEWLTRLIFGIFEA